MSLDTFPWSSATNYASGPDVGTPTKTDPGYNQITNLVPVGAQAVNYLFNERDQFLQQIPIGWQPVVDPGSSNVATLMASGYDPQTGLWFRGSLYASGGSQPHIEWCYGDGQWFADNTVWPTTGSEGVPTKILSFCPSPGAGTSGPWLVLATDGSYVGAYTFNINNATPSATSATIPHAGNVGAITTIGTTIIIASGGVGWQLYNASISTTLLTRATTVNKLMVVSSPAFTITAADADNTYAVTVPSLATTTYTFPSAMGIGSGNLIAGLAYHTAIDGAYWVVAVTGASGATFWTSIDGVAWTQKGALPASGSFGSRQISELVSSGLALVAVAGPLAVPPAGDQTAILTRVYTSTNGGASWQYAPVSLNSYTGSALLISARAAGGQVYVQSGRVSVMSDAYSAGSTIV